MAEWLKTTLGAICESSGGGIQTGPFGSQLHAHDYVQNGTPSVMPQNIGDNRIDAIGIARVSKGDIMRLSRYILHEGDIVYSRRGDVERRALVRAENHGWLCGTGCLRVRISDTSKFDSRFISYALGLSTSRAWIKRHAVGATMLNLNTSILSAVPLTVPSISKQRAIAEVLGALDDKIAANHHLHDLADKLCAAEVQQTTAAGTSRQLRDVLKLHYGKALPAAKRIPGDVVVYGSGGIAGSHNQSLVGQHGVVIGRKGTVGAIYWASGPHFPIDTTYYVEPTAPNTDEILYYVLQSAPLAELNSDSAVPGLNRDEAYACQVRFPDERSIERLSQTLRHNFRWMASVREETKILSATRDQLLPLLMSGKIRVRDAEKVVEEVT